MAGDRTKKAGKTKADTKTRPKVKKGAKAIPDGTPTKKDISKMKEAGRKKRKEASERREKEYQAKKAAEGKKERKNPVTAVPQEDGTFLLKGRSVDPTRDKNKALEPFGKQLWQRGLVLQIFPTEEQAEQIAKTIGCTRVVRNAYLQERIDLYNEKKETLDSTKFRKDYLPKMKEEKPWLKEVDKFALEAGLEHVDRAYKNFFQGNASFPKSASKFKPNGNAYTTKYTNNNIEAGEDKGLGTYVKLPKLGKVACAMPTVNKDLDGKRIKPVRMAFQDAFPKGTRITKATVKREGKHYTVSLALERAIDRIVPKQVIRADRICSADMGIHRFCDYGDGSGSGYVHVENPRWIKQHEKRLRRLQRSLSRKQYDQETHKGSKNWAKAKEKVAKEQKKIADQRKDMQHKLSREIADRYDVFICEDLNIKGMMQNRRLSKAIASVGWGQFLSMVEYKIKERGGLFIKVDRWFPSSKLCGCGHKYDLKLNERYWTCPACHKFNDRDDNAVDNLHKEGIRILESMGVAVIEPDHAVDGSAA